MSIVLNFGSLNLLELSGPVQACNRIALPSSKWYVWVQTVCRFMLVIHLSCKSYAEIMAHLPTIFHFFCLQMKRRETRLFTFFKSSVKSAAVYFAAALGSSYSSRRTVYSKITRDFNFLCYINDIYVNLGLYAA